MIVWLASYPRSGNSLTRLALFSLFGRRSGSVYRPMRGRRSDALRSMIDSRPLELLDALEGPAFVKTHELRHAGGDRPAIVIVRDGRDALVSYAHFLRETRAADAAFEDLLAELIREPRASTGTWSESVEVWRGRSAPTAMIRFEDLLAEPAVAVARAAAAIDAPLGEGRGELPAFTRLRRMSPANFRQGRVGSWRSEMPAALEEAFWRRHGATMEALGYER